LRTSISKNLHLGPQNGPGSENLLKIINCQNGLKTVLSHLEKVGGPRYPPGSFIGLISLDHFKFSFNLFTGGVPSLREFSQGPHNAFEGNPGLCGPPTTKNCSDSEGAPKKNKLSSIGVAGITIACFGTIIILILALMKTSRVKNKRLNKEDVETIISSEDRQGLIKFTDIVEATENFSDDYVIGSGTSGMVYKVVIPG
jgi:hypothetical protein